MTSHSVDNPQRPDAAPSPLTRQQGSLNNNASAGSVRQRRLLRDHKAGSFGATSGGPKLDVLVGVDVDGGSIRLIIRGTVTGQNLRAVYVLVKRANAVAPGLTIIVDFRSAVVGARPLEQILSASREGRLPSSVDPFDTPCRLLVLEPQVL